MKILSNTNSQKYIDAYNAAVSNINQCLEAMQLTRKKLPIISESDLLIPTAIAETIEADSSIVDEVEDTEEE